MLANGLALLEEAECERSKPRWVMGTLPWLLPAFALDDLAPPAPDELCDEAFPVKAAYDRSGSSSFAWIPVDDDEDGTVPDLCHDLRTGALSLPVRAANCRSRERSSLASMSPTSLRQGRYKSHVQITRRRQRKSWIFCQTL